ncbi:MAG: hypothetical protein MR432_09115 [Prevotellaceae bacterium]|nr:hypothetical protein [Prevotellaceae bacterium]
MERNRRGAYTTLAAAHVKIKYGVQNFTYESFPLSLLWLRYFYDFPLLSNQLGRVIAHNIFDL